MANEKCTLCDDTVTFDACERIRKETVENVIKAREITSEWIRLYIEQSVESLSTTLEDIEKRQPLNAEEISDIVKNKVNKLIDDILSERLRPEAFTKFMTNAIYYYNEKNNIATIKDTKTFDLTEDDVKIIYPLKRYFTIVGIIIMSTISAFGFYTKITNDIEKSKETIVSLEQKIKSLRKESAKSKKFREVTFINLKKDIERYLEYNLSNDEPQFDENTDSWNIHTDSRKNKRRNARPYIR